MRKGNPLVRYNAEKDPDYEPYCLRCTGLIRMKKVTHMLWKCKCGAVHDERTEGEHLSQDNATKGNITI